MIVVHIHSCCSDRLSQSLLMDTFPGLPRVNKPLEHGHRPRYAVLGSSPVYRLWFVDTHNKMYNPAMVYTHKVCLYVINTRTHIPHWQKAVYTCISPSMRDCDILGALLLKRYIYILPTLLVYMPSYPQVAPKSFLPPTPPPQFNQLLH